MPGAWTSCSIRICGREVGDLRPEDRERMPRRRFARGHHQRVGVRVGERQQAGTLPATAGALRAARGGRVGAACHHGPAWVSRARGRAAPGCPGGACSG